MALKTAKSDPDGVKKAFFIQEVTKTAQLLIWFQFAQHPAKLR